MNLLRVDDVLLGNLLGDDTRLNRFEHFLRWNHRGRGMAQFFVVGFDLLEPGHRELLHVIGQRVVGGAKQHQICKSSAGFIAL
ncbi:MAG TPA: hypothetical protein VGO11_26710 [Chthoniobacteraceae bacterium]|nr:hypothetical protein [Chthoniobacteraceae bacterium]